MNMRICAIDSSGLVAGVAISDNGICLAEYDVQYQVTHSKTLMPMLDQVMSRLETSVSDVDAYAVTAGPGSFTGLRIGIATVKGLGLAADRPVAAIPTLEALAYNAYGYDGYVCPIMDARRQQVYAGIYRFDHVDQRDNAAIASTDASGSVPVCDINSVDAGSSRQAGLTVSRIRVIRPQSAMSFDDLCGQLNVLCRDGGRVLFIGDGIPVFADRMSELLEVSYDLAPLHLNRQRAGSLAALANLYFGLTADERAGRGLEGCITDAEGLTPIYLRMSQAERERRQRDAGLS